MTSERSVKNEHGDDVERTNGRTNAGPRSEEDGGGRGGGGGVGVGGGGKEERERTWPTRGETGGRRRTSKNISENTAVRMSYRLADSTAAVATPVG